MSAESRVQLAILATSQFGLAHVLVATMLDLQLSLEIPGARAMYTDPLGRDGGLRGGQAYFEKANKH